MEKTLDQLTEAEQVIYDIAVLKIDGLLHRNIKEPQCTCTEFQKQRALCPVCDKEEFEKWRSTDLAELRKTLNHQQDKQ